MKLHPLLFFQLPALLPAHLTQKEEIACCGPLHSKKNKKECLNEKHKPCQHKSTNTIQVPEPQNAISFLQHPAAHGNGTKGTTEKKTPPQHAEDKFTQATDKGEKWVSTTWEKQFSQASSSESVKHFPIGASTVNFSGKGTRLTLGFQSLELKFQKPGWLYRC